MQRTIGNAAVTRMIEQQRHAHGPGCGHHGQPAPEQAAPVQRSAVHEVLRAPGRPLDGDTRTDMEARLGADLADVRLRTGHAAAASAAEIGTRAYASGSHGVIEEGGGSEPVRLCPPFWARDAQGQASTLPHEVTHTLWDITDKSG